MNVESVNELVDEILDSEGDIVIRGITFRRSYILRELDPIAYREIALNLIDEHLTDLRDDLESLDPELDADEVETLQGMIEELENY
jgi:hypothetical protein